MSQIGGNNEKNYIIGILVVVVIFLSMMNIKKYKELQDKQTKIDQMNIQINSLWENVLQLQEEYGKIIDKLYAGGNNVE